MAVKLILTDKIIILTFLTSFEAIIVLAFLEPIILNILPNKIYLGLLYCNLDDDSLLLPNKYMKALIFKFNGLEGQL